MKKTTQKMILVACCSALLSITAQARIIDGENVKSVNGVKWTKARKVNVQELVNQDLADDSVRLFFLRQADNDPIESSANVSVNDRYRVSLQPGNFVDTLSCSGVNRISADVTAHKNNDLLRDAEAYRLDGRQSYFFMIDVDDMGKTEISQLNPNQAMSMMEKMSYQNHQISRVVPNCLPEEENLSIELKVYFDTDKSFVKPNYYPEIERVVDYMKRFPDTAVTLEGHTDSHASDQYNEALSQRRVNAIRTILVEQYGIDANRISAIGYGESRPVADNATAEGRALNRRVMAVFQKQ